MEIGEKGICRLSVVPVGAQASDKSEQVTQLLFGDHYTINQVSDDRKWLRIEMYFDKYIGWIDVKQHYAISEAYFNQINGADYKICTDLTSSILYNKHHISIVIGSILPISTNELFKMEEQLAFNGDSKSLSQKREFEYLKQTVKKYLNAPYAWGGRSPFGIDCSGLVQNVYRICGYALPRDASQQVRSGVAVPSLEEVMPGDLAFFSGINGNITHVGIVLEDNQIIHASGRVRIDNLDARGIVDAQSGQVTHTFSTLRRIIRE
ncbi:C40 family peptidase [Fulvivirga kasyanovii]|uniref:NlpC/P60 family protein n=1 Tax=Fulvivirga kasyanovii TaxID=396812 RepID=A0ABW9RUX3_9BACT|nr:C40 family peptidase [Fulvivirga kasyanovii]MTI28029.1 NlpC/P60 family protein [Fulvivirga kasyanovii]